MKILSELEDRTSDPKLWDMVYYELSSVQYYLSVQNYLALCRVSMQLFGLYKIIIESYIYNQNCFFLHLGQFKQLWRMYQFIHESFEILRFGK